MSELTLVEFLTARLDEDEAVAREAMVIDAGERWSVGGLRYDPKFDAVVMLAQSEEVLAHAGEPEAAHIARHDPARVLVEVQAKRAIVEWATLDLGEGHSNHILRLLASVFSDHPDYNEGWKP